jgi:hypothetical protein
MAAKRAAADPRVQTKVSGVVRNDIAPRVKASFELARPEIQLAKDNAQRFGQAIAKTAAKHPLVSKAKDFLAVTTKRSK